MPTWVAEDARDIRLLQRTTGDERILTYQSQSQPPATCLQIKKTGKPSEAELVEALASDGHKTDSELADHVQQQAQTPLLAADWWPVGTEGKTTHLCGKWWVSVAGSHVYGYTPEMSAVADAIKKERDDQAQTRKN